MSDLVQEVEGAIKAAETAVATEAAKVEHAVVVEADKIVGDVEAEAKKLEGEAHDAIQNLEAALSVFVKAIKDEASKAGVIKELETVVDHLKNPVVDEAAALAAKAAHDAAVAAAKELETQAKEDALAASGWATRAWHRIWAWL